MVQALEEEQGKAEADWRVYSAQENQSNTEKNRADQGKTGTVWLG